MACVIRREEPGDNGAVEALTRDAFWNLHAPGCDEHYLVHIMRGHPDCIPELDLVMEVDGIVIGSILYTKATLVSETGAERPIVTFGPVSIAPKYQRRGYGKALIEHSYGVARSLGYMLIVIFGNPGNYVGAGFQSCVRYNICYGNGLFPAALLVKELAPGWLDIGTTWTYRESEVYTIDPEKARVFDLTFEAKEKRVTPSQEEFFILSNARIICNSTTSL